MSRHSHLQHPHQESRKGLPLYASTTRIKSTPNDLKEFQSSLRIAAAKKGSLKKSFREFIDLFWEDEDSDERTIYFGKQRESKIKRASS